MYANVAPAGDHVPGSAVSASPTTVVPLIVGGAVFVGPAAWAVTACVAFETAAFVPSAFPAVTRIRSRKPTSPATTT